MVVAPSRSERREQDGYGRDNIHVSIVAKRAILVVVLDGRCSPGLVRLRVERANGELDQIIDTMLQKAATPDDTAAFAEITDEDIDALFSE